MERSSHSKRLIDNGNGEHKYDEVKDLLEELSHQSTIALFGPPTVSENKEQIKKDELYIKQDWPSDVAKPIKLGKANKSKSKIPRSPSLSSTLSQIPGSINTETTKEKKHNPTDGKQSLPVLINYEKTKNKHAGTSSQTIPTSIVNPFTFNISNTRTPYGHKLSNYNNNDNIVISETSNNKDNTQINCRQKVNLMGDADMESSENCSSINSNNNTTSIGNSRGQRSNVNMSSTRRSQIPANIETPSKNFQYLTLIVRKDENGYGMKVSGDNPVFVESVKIGGAAQVAGLVAGDMILKVNGQEVRSEKHPNVVSLIKASTIVELSVKRSQKMVRPTSVAIVPSTPILSSRDRTASITGPQPVDSIKRREMETYKIQTLQKMIEQEKSNLESLKDDPNNPSYKLSEANIHKLRDQLRQVGAEDSSAIKLQTTVNSKDIAILPHNQIHHHSSNHHHQNFQQQHQHNHQCHQHHNTDLHTQAITPQQQPTTSSSPAFLSLLPRSLSSLSLGTRKNKIEKEFITSPMSSTTDFLNSSTSPFTLFNMSQSLHQQPIAMEQHQQQNLRNQSQQKHLLFNQKQHQQRIKDISKSSNVGKSNNVENFIQEDIPPPLPQRNTPRPQLSLDFGVNNNTTVHLFSPISDLDTQHESLQQPQLRHQNASSAQKKRSKTKIKALSDPKMSTKMFLSMETTPTSAILKCEDITEADCVPPPLPPRQPGMIEEVLGQTPQHLNQVNKHRRVVSSPDNMHIRSDRLNKTTSGSWDLVEKDNEVTPPGTPPPPYLITNSVSLSGNDEHQINDQNRESMADISINPLTSLAAGANIISPLPMPPMSIHSNRIQSAQSNVSQKEIISMEDEDTSDIEGPFIDENGPFNQLQRLLEPENIAFLAVFLNYLLSNSEPAPLLFYLITELYKEGTAKDMRKWAYEIHSTFLVPHAPLSWYGQDESLAREVDSVLQNEFDKVEILRKVFWKSRKRARDSICEQLREFQQKRTAGLGTMFGPTDAQLADAKRDKHREQQIFEDLLLGKLQNSIDDYEKDLPHEDAKKLALCSALSTVIHRIFITRPNNIVDRVHHFVSREKSFKSKFQVGKNRKILVRGHSFILRQYYEVTNCDHCHSIIWGVSPQGYHCTNCKLNTHRSCSKVLEDNCPGPLPQAKRKEQHNDNKIIKFMDKIRPRNSTDLNSSEKRVRHEDDIEPTDFGNERIGSASVVRQPSDRRMDENMFSRTNCSTSFNSSDLQSSFHSSVNSSNILPCNNGGNVDGSITTNFSCDIGIGNFKVTASTTPIGGVVAESLTSVAGPLVVNDTVSDELYVQNTEMLGNVTRLECLPQKHQNKCVSTAVNRSESYKERISHKRNRNSRRKTSDPSLMSRPSNEEKRDVALLTSNSDCSLSSGGGSESPSTSMEQMAGAGVLGSTINSTHHHHHMAQQIQPISTNSQDSNIAGSSNPSICNVGISLLSRHCNFDSDDDDDLKELDWSSNVNSEILTALTDAEKKRQEIINEIYQTERSHVRTLKLLERLFFCPLQESGVLSHEHLILLFPPALLSLRELHSAFEQQLKQRRLEHNYLVKHIGDLLSGMFHGQSGEDLCEFAAQFCARQQIALEALKEKRRKDEQLQKILTKAESHKSCRRLQLKDLLPTVLQRLTKYPLLFENLYRVTLRVVPDNTFEAEAIQRALDSSKKILVDVNQAVKTAEDTHKLQNIQRKLDKSTLDEFKNLDLTQYHLIHDGSLTLKKNPTIQLHGLLFDNMIVLLTKQDDKYSLKYLSATHNTEANNKPVSPIMNIDSETLVRLKAADKNTFFLIKTKTSQMLELRAPSSSECKTWFKQFSDAAEQYKPRLKNANNANNDHILVVDDPSITTLPYSNSKEVTPERLMQGSSTTITTTPLAPMMSPSTSTTGVGYNQPFGMTASVKSNLLENEVQLRKDQEECNPVILESSKNSQQRMSCSDVTPGLVSNVSTMIMNRSMSTRSCGETSNSYTEGGDCNENSSNSITLRHTQSARQVLASDNVRDSCNESNSSKRDSISIVYSNNSNNTRTLMQPSVSLVEPSAIQISISPAHTAEPVLTTSERLRRLDASIRHGLLEKQKIICDMYRLPFEHFDEIIDIAGMPEAPKDSSDIALAAYAQVHSLTEVLNECMQATYEQDKYAVFVAICDQCSEKKELLTSQPHDKSQIPPPLPPPKKNENILSVPSKLHPPIPINDSQIHEDDDGYCEIDELRLPALPSLTKPPNNSNDNVSKHGKHLLSPQRPTVQSQTNCIEISTKLSPTSTSNHQQEQTTTSLPISTSELINRPITLSSNNILEESNYELNSITNDGVNNTMFSKESANSIDIKIKKEINTEQIRNSKTITSVANCDNGGSKEVNDKTASYTANATLFAGAFKIIDAPVLDASDEAKTPLDKLSRISILVDQSTQTLPNSQITTNDATNTISNENVPVLQQTNNNSIVSTMQCGPNRMYHKSKTLEPSVPCHSLTTIVSSLNEQISLLLPKINERDMERERLRKENQHLRELLNAMHERQRVAAKSETPENVKSGMKSNKIKPKRKYKSPYLKINTKPKSQERRNKKRVIMDVCSDNAKNTTKYVDEENSDDAIANFFDAIRMNEKDRECDDSINTIPSSTSNTLLNTQSTEETTIIDTTDGITFKLQQDYELEEPRK